MRWLWIVAGVVGALILLVLGVGLVLPRSHRATGSRSFAAAPEDVWRALVSVEAYPSWRPDVQRVALRPAQEGRRVWTEHGTQGATTFIELRVEPPRLWVVRVAPGGPFGGSWTYSIEPAASGSRVTITEDGEIYNPVFRFVARFFMDMNASIERYLEALDRRLASAGEARRAPQA